MKKITEMLKEQKFHVSIEIVPPRNGEDFEKFFDSISGIKQKAAFASVTKGAGGSLRAGSLPISYLLQEKLKIPVVSHMVCRERTKQEIENDAVDSHYLGINNILALRGDPPAGSTEGWNGDYKYAYLLIEQLKKMNSGFYLPRQGQDNEERKGVKTDFCVFAAGHPEDKIEDEIVHIKAKQDAGADGIITQMIFSFDDYLKYRQSLEKAGITIPIIPGIRPITTLKQALFAESFFKVKIPDKLKQGLEKGGNFGVEYFAELVGKLKDSGCRDAHFFVLNDTELFNEIAGRI